MDLVKKDFEQLHHFLRLEEAARISILEDEAEMKNEIMQEKLEDLSNKIVSLSNTIQNKESDLEKEDIQFFQVTNQKCRKQTIVLSVDTSKMYFVINATLSL